ncbi:MAG: LysE/ArgO family amino acid transporter [Aeromicrobium sp.]
MGHATVTGFLAGLSLIVAIGAQNAYVLRQGVLRAHVGPVVAVCAVSDVVLIVAGVSGVGALIDHAGQSLTVVRWFGVTFLLWYAVGALRRASRAEALFSESSDTAVESRHGVVGRAFVLTWLNPHVYLDTVLLLGSIAATQSDVVGGRWWFAAGACAASVVWFNGLGFGAGVLAPLFARPRAWQVLDVGVAATLILVAARLALG